MPLSAPNCCSYYVTRAILHVDMDAFFASIEQRDNPALRGRPVVVGGGGPRGVVAAASYEVRKFGVRSAMPTRRALALCPEAICVPPRMARYREVSDAVFAIFAEYTPLIEGLSLDEAYLDVTDVARLHGNAGQIATTIKRRIHNQTGLTASIGIAPNKLVAKIASDLNKPDGLTIVEGERIALVLDPLPVTRLPGLGRKLGQAVLAAGIATLGELRQSSDARLWPLFGKDAPRMRDRAAGIDDRPVVSERRELSISAECTFDVDIKDHALLNSEILALADRASRRLRAQGLLASCVTVKIRCADFSTFTRQRPLVPPTNDSRVIANQSAVALAAWLKARSGTALRLLGVGLSGLGGPQQAELFGAESTQMNPNLDSAIDEIRGKFGNLALFRAGSAPNRGS
jgi:DNA polymerase IV